MLNKFEKFIEKHIDKPWEWGNNGLSKNPSITMEFVEKHIDKPWFWGRDGLSRNPSITIEFVEKYIDKPWKWGDDGLSRSTFSYELKRDHAARVIQNACHDLLWAPNHNGKPGLMVSRMLRELNK